jgi:hypothetical protein
LHEEVHQLHNQLQPYVPPGAAKMDFGEDPEEPKLGADDDDATAGDNGNVSKLDSKHDE